MLRIPLNRRSRRPGPPVVALALGLLCATVGAQAVDRVQSLEYGAALFQFYQQDYFDAITELMVGQERQSLGVHTEGAELLRGGMSLSYGMDDAAESVFSKLISDASDSKVASSAVRDQAWFYLAKLAWQRDETERTESSLEKISTDYKGKLRDEANYLRAAVALHAGDEVLAQSYARMLPYDSPWRYYQAYNRGAKKAAVGEWGNASRQFDVLVEISGTGEELKRLKDRGMTAAGFAMMAAGEPAGASERFAQVRLDNTEADRALLGYGWALSELDDYAAAISPWQALSERSPMSESVRQGLLALPYAYEKLGSASLALVYYQQAAERYNAELEKIEQAILQFSAEDLDPLLGLDGEEASSGEWLGGADLFPREQPSEFLGHLITRHSFQMALRELRDLRQLSLRLEEATQRIEVMKFVDAHQRSTWAEVVEGDRASELAEKHEALITQVSDLKARLARAQAQDDPRWTAGPEQSARWEKLERVQQLADDLAGSPETLASIELLRGMLIWEDSEDYPARSWQLQQQMKDLDELVAESRRRMDTLTSAIANRRNLEFSPRISGMESRIERQRTEVVQAAGSSEEAIRQIAVRELQQYSAGVSQALAQSKLAIARLHDQESTGVLP